MGRLAFLAILIFSAGGASGAFAQAHDPVRELLDRQAFAAPDTPMLLRRDPDDHLVLTRSWPAALNLSTSRFDVAVTPHVGVGRRQGAAEAGAMVQLSQHRDALAADRLADLGVRDGAVMGDQGRWYVFAAASGRAVGLNMLRGESGWDRAGWTTDTASALVGDAQVGVGWRKGHLQTSFGVIHREVKGQHMIFGQETRDDTLAAFSLSIKPAR